MHGTIYALHHRISRISMSWGFAQPATMLWEVRTSGALLGLLYTQRAPFKKSNVSHDMFIIATRCFTEHSWRIRARRSAVLSARKCNNMFLDSVFIPETQGIQQILGLRPLFPAGWALWPPFHTLTKASPQQTRRHCFSVIQRFNWRRTG